MITFEKFKKIIVNYILFEKYIDKLYAVKIDVIETPLFETTGVLLDEIWNTNFTEETVDTINWFLFEHHNLSEDFNEYGQCVLESEEDAMWDVDGTPIPMRTIEDLWAYVKDYTLDSKN